jgi:RNA polymerase sigma factor (sigma-70 family)
MASTRAKSARAAVDHSFEELYRGHRSDVYRAVLRDLGDPHDAEDVTQAAFLDAYRAVLRGSQPQSPRAWLLAIAENVRRRRFRTSQRRPREVPLDADFPVTAELSHELAQGLAGALAELPDEQRQVFLLREFGELSYDEIADRLDATVGSVQMLLFRARRSLREQLEPPTVSRRRAGLLVPLPGWLTTIASRVEMVGLAPRAAGAVGAAVLTVVGASVAVSGPEAATPAPADAPVPVFVAPKSTTSSSGTALASMRVSGASVASRSAPFRAGVGTPASKRAVPVEDEAGATPSAPTTATSAPGSANPAPASANPGAPVAKSVPAISAPERPPISVPLPLPEPERPLELPVPPPSSVLPIAPPPIVPPVTVPPVVPPVTVPPVVPPVTVPPVVPPAVVPPVAVPPATDPTAGAAGAAGAGAPPLPVPALPPIPLPPA